MICSLDWTYTWLPELFCSDLTLESQSNLVLFWFYTWKPIKLVVQILPYVYLPRLTFHYQSGCAFDFAIHVDLIGLTTLIPCEKTSNLAQLGFGLLWKTPIYLKLPSFSSKVFLKLLSGARPFFTLHSSFRQENIYLMQMCYAMYDYEWHVWVFKLIFHLNLFCSSVFCFSSPMCSLRACFSDLLCSLKRHFCPDAFLSYRNLLCARSLWSFDSSIVGKHFKPSLICSCWILVLTFVLSINSKQIMKTYQSNALILFM